jgi:hypothetical protein
VKFKNLSKTTIFPFTAILLIFFSCGIEEYPYIYPIPAGNVRQIMNSVVEIDIPDNNESVSNFTHYIIFYRIYISDIDMLSPSESNFNTINSALNNDYARVRPYIGNDSMGSSTIASLFNNINYYPLGFESQNADTVLSRNILGHTLVLDFSSGTGNYPHLAVAGKEYILHRSNGSGSFEPLPDSYFVNSNGLWNPDNLASNSINLDITAKQGVEGAYTYVSMFIVAVGLDSQTFAQLFSSPTFVGVLRLPD